MKANKIVKRIKLTCVKYRRGINLSWFWIFILLLISNCQYHPLQRNRLIIDKQNVGNIVEVTKLKTGSGRPIAAMVIPPGSQNLFLSQAGTEGIVQKWDLLEQKRLNKIDIGPVSVTGAAFDRSGQLLALTAGETGLTSQEMGYSTDDLSGLVVVNTETGEIETEFGFGYGGVRRPEGDILSAVAFSPDGRWLIVGDDVGFIVWNMEENKSIVSSISWRRASAITSTDNQAVIAFEDGHIDFYQLDAQSLSASRMDISDVMRAFPEVPLALALSPDDRWLAHLGQSNLIFFDLEEINRVCENIDELPVKNSNGTEPQTVQEFLSAFIAALRAEVKRYSPSKAVPSGPAGALAFNPTGDLLAVGTVAGWQIWDVAQQELLVEKEAEGVYALTFSPDGRWFVWGDANGTVHLWAVLGEPD